MGLPNVGPLELIIVLAIALVVLGPRRLPEMGSAMGKTIREFRKASSAIADPITAEPASESPKDVAADETIAEAGRAATTAESDHDRTTSDPAGLP